jgi:hypothetical protein
MIATALEAALAFNLVCSGTVRTGPLGLVMPEAGGEPVAITYRVDLEARLWCSDACETTERLDSVFEGVIVLRDLHYPAGSSVIMVNPATGRFSDTRVEWNRATLTSGACEVAPFTGFLGRTA